MTTTHSKDFQTILKNRLWTLKEENTFSKCKCEGCGNQLAGIRFIIEFKNDAKDEKISELSICVDCIDYLI